MKDASKLLAAEDKEQEAKECKAIISHFSEIIDQVAKRIYLLINMGTSIKNDNFININ